MSELFVKQLDGCTYHPPGENCTCAAHASWTVRATQGRIRRSSCATRRLTGDTSGGTNLGQMQAIATRDGVPGVLWRPGRFDKLRELVLTGRYGASIGGGYGLLANTAHDCFDGGFRGGHGFYIKGGTADDASYSDPGADGRRATIPKGWQSIDWDWLQRVAGALPLAPGVSLAQEHGSGMVYALLTPADPVVVLERFRVVIDGNTTTRRTPLYAAPNGVRVGAISDASYIVTRSKVGGLWWYRIVTAASGRATANAGRYFKPNSWMEWSRA